MLTSKPAICPGVCKYFLDHAVEIIPTTIGLQYGPNPYKCHVNALEYAAGHPGAFQWFGFQYLFLEGGETWELHSFAIEADGTLINSR